MSIGNFMCAGAVLATFVVVSMCCAFWCGVAVGRRDGARTLEGCQADVPADGGVSVDFCPSSPDVASTSGYAEATPLRSSGESGRL